jgi:hypothetical protein
LESLTFDGDLPTPSKNFNSKFTPQKVDKTNMSNFRPISILSTFYKVIENVTHNKISHYLKANNILVPEQFGFRKGISTKNAAFKLTHCILK